MEFWSEYDLEWSTFYGAVYDQCIKLWVWRFASCPMRANPRYYKARTAVVRWADIAHVAVPSMRCKRSALQRRAALAYIVPDTLPPAGSDTEN